MPVNPALGRQRQRIEFKTSLNYVCVSKLVRTILKGPVSKMK